MNMPAFPLPSISLVHFVFVVVSHHPTGITLPLFLVHFFLVVSHYPTGITLPLLFLVYFVLVVSHHPTGITLPPLFLIHFVLVVSYHPTGIPLPHLFLVLFGLVVSHNPTGIPLHLSEACAKNCHLPFYAKCNYATGECEQCQPGVGDPACIYTSDYCHMSCKNSTTGGVWRGIEISHGFDWGEWDFTFFADNKVAFELRKTGEWHS